MASVLRQRKPHDKNTGNTSEDDNSEKKIIYEPSMIARAEEKVKSWRSLITGRRAALIVGVLSGFVACLLLVARPPKDLAVLLEDFDLPSFPLDLSSLGPDVDWKDLFAQNSPLVPWNIGRANFDGSEFTVGEALANEGHTANYPVILIPGIISTALENWSTFGEFKKHFRKRYWGGASMVVRAIQDPERWMAALMLDPNTGLDPPGVKIRAAQGIDAAEKFIEGYWLWEKIIQNLAVLNYDTNNLELAAYDWRLSYRNLETRDNYFSRLKYGIESHKRRYGKKSVIVAHSMGGTVMLYFLKWVEAPGHGDGGPNWVEDHIEAVISIGATFLGVPKAMVAFLSGEMKDTVAMSPAASYVLERFFSKKDRAKLFRSWAGSASMWIKGGEAVWGNGTHAPDDADDAEHSHGHFVAFRDTGTPTKELHERTEPDIANITAGKMTDWILESTPVSYQKMVVGNYSFGLERDEKQLQANNHDFRKWANPLEIQLPQAPSLKIFCAYGHGLETERSYWYTRGRYANGDTLKDDPQAQCGSDTGECSPNPDSPMVRSSWIDNEITDDMSRPKVKNGVRIGEGDGTVSLISLGAMCAEGWRRKRWNPAGVKVITYEIKHSPEAWSLRGGPNSGDHIDVLGSTALNEIIAKVAVGAGNEIKEHFVSNVQSYAQKINWDDGLPTELW